MPRVLGPRTILAAACALLVTGLLGACGGEIEVPEQDTAQRRGAVLFNQRCSGCHTLKPADAYGSAPARLMGGGERTNGPNFDQRKENREDVLFAIRNGGFSGAIMPANIVVGEDADLVADFVAKYSGSERTSQAE
jgi:mono/diheme cytochrome c family protein